MIDRFRLKINAYLEQLVRSKELGQLQQQLGVPVQLRMQANVDYELVVWRTLASIKSIVRPSYDTLIDIGAHRGGFARAASLVLPIQRFVCVEPDLNLLPKLQKSMSGLSVDFVTSALSDEGGTARFFVHEDPMMNSLLAADDTVLRENFPYDRAKPIERQVDIETLDALIERLNLPGDSHFLIKIDVQGNELNVLQSGRRVLARTTACLVEHMFLNPYEISYSFWDLVRFMDKCGFECRGSFAPSFRPNWDISGVNYLFVRKVGD